MSIPLKGSVEVPSCILINDSCVFDVNFSSAVLDICETGALLSQHYKSSSKLAKSFIER
jgi:hypothetical protein